MTLVIVSRLPIWVMVQFNIRENNLELSPINVESTWDFSVLNQKFKFVALDTKNSVGSATRK